MLFSVARLNSEIEVRLYVNSFTDLLMTASKFLKTLISGSEAWDTVVSILKVVMILKVSY